MKYLSTLTLALSHVRRGPDPIPLALGRGRVVEAPVLGLEVAVGTAGIPEMRSIAVRHLITNMYLSIPQR